MVADMKWFLRHKEDDEALNLRAIHADLVETNKALFARVREALSRVDPTDLQEAFKTNGKLHDD
jgi:hypothetical protein